MLVVVVGVSGPRMSEYVNQLCFLKLDLMVIRYGDLKADGVIDGSKVLNCFSIDADSVNDSSVHSKLIEVRPDYAVFSGFSGEIVSSETLSLGFPFVHVHPGKLPDYRGSTTIYYSFLTEKSVFATAFFMSLEIDSGEVIRIDEHEVPNASDDVDIKYDGRIRALTLKNAFSDLLNGVDAPFANNSTGKLYFVIHPALKHMVLDSVYGGGDFYGTK